MERLTKVKQKKIKKELVKMETTKTYDQEVVWKKAHEIYPGTFITFEGSDGSGKDTILKKLVNDSEYNIYDLIKRKQIDKKIVISEEPGGTKFGEKIKKAILDHYENKISPLAELFAYLSSRNQHWFEKIKPELENGNIVISSRYADSSLIYQGIARGVNKKYIEWSNNFVDLLNYFACDGIMPDLTIYLRISPEEAMLRIKDKKKDRLEEEGIEFQEKVIKAYENVLIHNISRVRIVDASKNQEEVLRESYRIIEDFIEKTI